MLKAIAIERGEIPMVELPNMPAPTSVPKAVIEEEKAQIAAALHLTKPYGEIIMKTK